MTNDCTMCNHNHAGRSEISDNSLTIFGKLASMKAHNIAVLQSTLSHLVEYLQGDTPITPIGKCGHSMSVCSIDTTCS